MSGDCDICGDWGHVEESCPNIETALSFQRADRAKIKKEILSLQEGLSRAESEINFLAELLYKQRKQRKQAGAEVEG